MRRRAVARRRGVGSTARPPLEVSRCIPTTCPLSNVAPLYRFRWTFLCILSDVTCFGVVTITNYVTDVSLSKMVIHVRCTRDVTEWIFFFIVYIRSVLLVHPVFKISSQLSLSKCWNVLQSSPSGKIYTWMLLCKIDVQIDLLLVNVVGFKSLAFYTPFSIQKHVCLSLAVIISFAWLWSR